MIVFSAFNVFSLSKRLFYFMTDLRLSLSQPLPQPPHPQPIVFLPPANEVCEGYAFTGVCLSTPGEPCMVLFGGGHAWFYSGGVCGFIQGACMVLFGGMHGFIWGACVVLFGGCAWFYSGACMVLFGGHV